jgi:class 3 adenylate cyclase
VPQTTGYIAIADISGYTTFVADTEIEHSREILAELLEVTSRELERHLRLSRVQGDALICVGEEDEVIPCLEDAFLSFHRRVRAMVAATTCPCNACRSVPNLTLKFVAQHGTYSTVSVRGTVDLVGADVNIAFRLLKNHVPSHEYILATNSVLERLPALARERFVPISEDYDLGHVEAGYRDLHDLRERAYQQLTQRVTPRDADFTLTATLDAPPADAYAELVRPSTMQRVAGAPKITLKSGARGTLANAAYHCEHGANRKTIFEVIRDDPSHELTMWVYGDGPEAYATYTFEPLGADRTRLGLSLRVANATGLKHVITSVIFRFYFMRGLRQLRAIVRASREPVAKTA